MEFREQGQRLMVVIDAGTHTRIARLLHEDECVAQGREPWMSVATAHIVVCTREQDYHDRYNQPDKLALTGGVEIAWPAPFWYVDAGAALMLSHGEGPAAGVYGVTVPEMQAFKDSLGIPDDVWVVAGVTIGKARPDPNASLASSRLSQRMRPLEEVVRWERW